MRIMIGTSGAISRARCIHCGDRWRVALVDPTRPIDDAATDATGGLQVCGILIQSSGKMGAARFIAISILIIVAVVVAMVFNSTCSKIDRILAVARLAVTMVLLFLLGAEFVAAGLLLLFRAGKGALDCCGSPDAFVWSNSIVRVVEDCSQKVTYCRTCSSHHTSHSVHRLQQTQCGRRNTCSQQV